MYIYTKRHGFNKIHTPRLTQALGPWIKDTGAKYCKKIAREKDLFYELIEKLPPLDAFAQSFHHSFINWLPFYWKGVRQTTNYTYILEDLTDLEKIWSGFQENIRTDIRKAQKTVTTKVDLDIHNLVDIQIKTFSRQNLLLPFSKEFI